MLGANFETLLFFSHSPFCVSRSRLNLCRYWHRFWLNVRFSCCSGTSVADWFFGFCSDQMEIHVEKHFTFFTGHFHSYSLKYFLMLHFRSTKNFNISFFFSVLVVIRKSHDWQNCLKKSLSSLALLEASQELEFQHSFNRLFISTLSIVFLYHAPIFFPFFYLGLIDVVVWSEGLWSLENNKYEIWQGFLLIFNTTTVHLEFTGDLVVGLNEVLGTLQVVASSYFFKDCISKYFSFSITHRLWCSFQQDILC